MRYTSVSGEEISMHELPAQIGHWLLMVKGFVGDGRPLCRPFAADEVWHRLGIFITDDFGNLVFSYMGPFK